MKHTTILALALGLGLATIFILGASQTATAETTQYGILFAKVYDWDNSHLLLETNITLQLQIWLDDGLHEYTITPGGSIFWTSGVNRWRLYSTNPGDKLTYTDETVRWDIDLDTEIWYRTGQVPTRITYSNASNFNTIVVGTNMPTTTLRLNFGEPYRSEWLTTTADISGTAVFNLDHTGVAVQVVGPPSTTYESEDENWTVVTSDGWVEFQNIHITYTEASDLNTIVVETDLVGTVLRLNYGEPHRTEYVTTTVNVSGTATLELEHTGIAVQVVGPLGTTYISQDQNWEVVTTDGWIVYIHKLFLPLILH